MNKKRNFWTRLLVLFLGMMGFACGSSESDENDLECLYGSPSADFRVIGTISDESGNLLDNVEGVFSSMDGCDKGKITLDSAGHFSSAISALPMDNRFYIKVKSEGCEPDSIAFTIDEPLEGGDGPWYKGMATKTLDIVLKKAPESQPDQDGGNSEAGN